MLSPLKNMQTYNLYKIHNSRPHNFGGGVGETLLYFKMYFKIMKWRDCIVDSGIHTSPQQMSNSFCWVNATPLEQTTCRHEILHQLIILLVICLLITYGYKSEDYLRQWCIVVVWQFFFWFHNIWMDILTTCRGCDPLPVYAFKR